MSREIRKKVNKVVKTINKQNVSFLQDGFTFTGLLQGQFDSFYTQDTAKQKVTAKNKIILV
jgi:hypothetical protein